MIAKTAINKLKLVPGFANLAADVLNAIVAGSIVFAIGESSILVMEKIYNGEIDREDFDWVDSIVEGNLGIVIQKVTRIVNNSNGKISATSILKELVSK